jgi:hypothetical protein
MNFGKTYEFLLQKVCLQKVSNNGKNKNLMIIGCEYGPPRVGKPYVIHVGKENVFKTTPVKDIKETYTALMIKTKNSIYRIKYLKDSGNASSDPASRNESYASM